MDSSYRAGQPHGLMFHRLHRAGTPSSGQGSIADQEFEGILDFVGVDRILRPEVWLQKLARGTLASTDACLTFDDGLRSQRDVALPILQRRGLAAFWFVFSSVFRGAIDRNEVYNSFATTYFSSFDEFASLFLARAALPTDVFSSDKFLGYGNDMRNRFSFYSEVDIKFRFVRNFVLNPEHYSSVIEGCMAEKRTSVPRIAAELWLDDGDLLELSSSGHAIGLHSFSHPLNFADLPAAEQRAEYESNFEHIASVTGTGPVCMSHPLGSYSRMTLNILSELGIVCGFGSSMTPGFDLDDFALANLQIPRADAADVRRMYSGALCD